MDKKKKRNVESATSESEAIRDCGCRIILEIGEIFLLRDILYEMFHLLLFFLFSFFFLFFFFVRIFYEKVEKGMHNFTFSRIPDIPAARFLAYIITPRTI